MEPLMGEMSAGMSWLASSPGSLHGGKDGERSAPAALSPSAILSPEATRLGKAGSLLFCPGAAGAHLPWGASEQSLDAMTLHTTLLEQEMLPQSLS